MTTRELTVVNPDTTPYLRGRYAPVHEETDAGDLPAAGTIPTDLTGLFVRNGPNPEFPPLGSFSYPFEGDGMVHGVWLDGGRARYRNRWVRTLSLRAEERAGRALYGGLLTPAFVDPGLLGEPADSGWPFKVDASINVVRHAGRLLALGEGVQPYRLDDDLETLGPETFGGALAAGMCAHPRFDPLTGEMVYFRYDTEPPYLLWGALAADGTPSRPETAVDGLERCHVVHDFALTRHYAVLVVAPLVLDVGPLTSGDRPGSDRGGPNSDGPNSDGADRAGAVLSWRPALGTRVALVPRAGGPVRWVETDAFWVWHIANAYERTGGYGQPGAEEVRIVLDFPWWSRPGLGIGSEASASDTLTSLRGSFTRATIDPAAGSIELHHLNYMRSEFPRVDSRRTGRAHRYVTVVARSADERLARGEHDRLVRHDMDAGLSVSYDTGLSISEAVFAPRDGAREELDGYYLCFATSLSEPGTTGGADGGPDGGAGCAPSWLLIWDAGDFPANPVARVRLPRRVPNGLHASWLPAPGTERHDRREGDRRTRGRRASDREARAR